MRTDRLGDLGSPAAVLRAVAAEARRRGLPPPAALTGEWFGSAAVIAPSLQARPVDPDAVFDVPAGPGGDVVGGGWIGYLSYPDPGDDGEPPRVPVAAGGWTDCVLRLDADGCWWFESLLGRALPRWVAAALAAPQRVDAALAAPQRVAAALAAPQRVDAALTAPLTAPQWEIDWRAPDPVGHRAAVLACLEAIRAGEVYQACVCTQFVGDLTGSSVDFFADAVSRTAPARAAYLAGDWGAVASLSPELFLRRAGEQVDSSPIKGTLPLDRSPAALLASAKDVAENIMIVDLVRNDLGRVAVTGSVSVPELLMVRPAPGVWHLVSTVSARIVPELSNTDLLAATFPPASVTGTPKTRARQLLSQWEPQRRGVYCGTVGMASPIAGCELNVAIRTVEFDSGGAAVLGVGGGITADSDPDTEWQECLHKAASIVGQSGSVRERSTAS